jgi:acetyl-CoA synthetase
LFSPDKSQLKRVFGQREDWDTLQRSFEFRIPERFNMADVCCDVWADAVPNKVAIIHVDDQGETREVTYKQLQQRANQLAQHLASFGVVRGDRIAVLLPQCPEVLIAHIAAYKLGAIVLPLFTQFGPDALHYRLADSGGKICISDQPNTQKLHQIEHRLPDLKAVLNIDDDDNWSSPLGASSGIYATCDTHSEEPAVLIYTSGTTGPPKGALHAHRFLFGHLPGMELYLEYFPQAGDKGWTPADWAWIGGLMDMAIPCLYYGVPLISHRMAKFDATKAYELIAKHDIRNLFLPPTALKMMRQVTPPAGLNIRSIMSGGEALGPDLLDWGKSVLGVQINEAYGQTECNICVGSCAGSMQQKPGSMGRAIPGFDIAIINEEGTEVPRGTVGEIAVKRDNPIVFLRYWQQPAKTEAKFVGDWLKTGDTAYMDDQGYIYFSGRDDDVITSSGYRIGPTEIENCLIGHPKVVNAAAVGIPDPTRTEIVKAFVVLVEGADADGLSEELIARVRKNVSAHVAPRLVEFVPELPMTATGKVMRRKLRETDGT